MAARKKGYKRRNSEKRKEKSRDAARTRRTKECEIFNDLSDQLPVPMSEIQQLDKASIMRLAISHLKLRKLLGKSKSVQTKDLQKKLDTQYQKALEGFVLIIAREGDIMYLSESVSKYLGITQIELIGQSIYDFTHPCDHEEIQEILMEKSGKADEKRHTCNFLMRMKCTLTSKGRNINLKSANYKVIRCSGRYVCTGSGSHQFVGLPDEQKLSCLLLIAEPIPHPSNIEVPLDGRTFVSRHSLDMKFTYCDDRINSLLGYYSHNLINQSLFDYHHAMDSANVREACKDLFSKGQAVITNYRFLAYGGGFARVQTEATVINNQRTDRPQCVVCVNYVLSGVEAREVIMSPVQMGQLPVGVPADDLLSSGLVPSTETIFAPRPKDADDDMLQITGLDGRQQILNDMLELAPSAGPVFLDLSMEMGMAMDDRVEDSPSMFEEYRNVPLVSPSASSGMSTTDMTVLDLSFLRDPKKETGPENERSMSQDTFSGSSNYSSSKYCSTTPETVISEGLDEIDFYMRAPYIPMDGSDDQIFDSNWVPIVDDDMLNSRMIGITETVFEPKPPEPEDYKTNNDKVPFSILRLQASQKNIDVSNGEIARNAGPPKMKRPMETNRLETGPPKLLCMQDQPSISSILNCSIGNTKIVPGVQDILNDTPTGSSNSVLQNLLTTGEDANYGYRVSQSKALAQLFDRGGTLRSLLSEASSDDDSDMVDVDNDMDSDDFSLPDLIDRDAAAVQFISPPKSTVLSRMTVEPKAPTATVTTATNNPASRTNLVVIRTNNTVLFAPIPAGNTGGSSKILGGQVYLRD